MKYELTKEQVKVLIRLCVYDIESNKDLIKSIKNIREIGVWKEENDFLKGIIKVLKQEKNQFVLQALTKEQEDYLLEESLERARESRCLNNENISEVKN